MISYDEAARLIGEAAQPLASEQVAIAQAAGRVLAAPVIAHVDAPPADSSAMDGYAVREADLPGVLPVIGESFAGRGFAGTVAPGTCVRIFTGAPVPAGADRVVIQENVTREGELATMPPGAGAWHIRQRGSDFTVGDILVEAGTRLGPRALVTAAGADLAKVEVWRRPRVIILATGDELAAPGEARLNAERIPESVSFGVAAVAQEWGAEVVDTRRLRDDLATMEQAAGEAIAQADLVVVTGGASVGEKDFAKTMFAPCGLDLVFSKVAIKPGKPVWLGRCSSSLVMGLPGNPTSAMVTARLFFAPLVAGLSGRTARTDWVEVPLACELAACGDRETFVRARRTPAGAVPVGNQDSSAQAALAQADLLLRCRPNQAARQAGELVDAIDF
ncbi:molybdopterin molybdotransferase MoeA [Parafrankia sp. BMG5.11]|uniref:molybdopterin molybdotransferase MoeA n=1 Tax=Parafrankia sp. BMG5.11 TaxID=222540 RepID=UPI001039A330|nr:molybdopterin molybdotransferase MoeA [Parafrankia sp. BMG5.11]TCJ39079.1 molybdopterin molybdenumtransferase MoeA [Parafrankia sp. BMG5.11]